MPVTAEKIKMLFEIEERNVKLKFGRYLYNIGKKVKGANSTRNIQGAEGGGACVSCSFS